MDKGLGISGAGFPGRPEVGTEVGTEPCGFAGQYACKGSGSACNYPVNTSKTIMFAKHEWVAAARLPNAGSDSPGCYLNPYPLVATTSKGCARKFH